MPINITTSANLGVLPNGTLINGICHIYQNTKPTTRPDGSALVIGDIWYSIAKGQEAFWNGTYWLSKELFYASFTASTGATNSFIGSGTGSGIGGGFDSPEDAIFCIKGKISWTYTGYSVGVNYYDLQLSIKHLVSNVDTNTILINTYTTTAGVGQYSLDLNTPLFGQINGIKGWVSKIGNPSTIYLNEALLFRYIYL